MKIAVVRDIKGNIGDMGLSYLVGGDWNMNLIVPFSWDVHHPN